MPSVEQNAQHHIDIGTAAAPNQNVHSMITKGKKGITKPKTPFAGYISHTATATPSTTIEALNSSVWHKAMKEEFEALQQNNTWSLVPATSSMHIVGSKWIFKIKYKADGTIERNKARLVAQGFRQTPGVNYFETFIPMIKLATVRIILTLIASYNWPVHQLDFNNAFLNGTLQKVVYMSQSQGFDDKNKSLHVCKLYKAL